MFTPAQPVESIKLRSRRHQQSPGSVESQESSSEPHNVTAIPPRSPPSTKKRFMMEEESEGCYTVFYAKWWMCGFSDACTDVAYPDCSSMGQ